jgi:hypothetical protein
MVCRSIVVQFHLFAMLFVGFGSRYYAVVARKQGLLGKEWKSWLNTGFHQPAYVTLSP